jgi:hypothetical protein
VAFLESAGIGGKIWALRKDDDSGEYFNDWANDNKLFIGVATLNGLLAVISSLLVTYVLFKNFSLWRGRQVELWGRLWYGNAEFNRSRDEIFAKADIFFISEFLVGFPGKHRKYALLCSLPFTSPLSATFTAPSFCIRTLRCLSPAPSTYPTTAH